MRTTVYRVIPWHPDADARERGGPLYIPPRQGGSRIDNPDRYRVLYASDSAAGAIGERFGRRLFWTQAMLRAPGTDSPRALVSYTLDASVLDLDDGSALMPRNLRPSEIATPDRDRTQRWALGIFEEGAFDGVRWWSVRDSRWGVFGLWNVSRLVPERADPLDRDHPLVQEVARMLGRPWRDD